MKPVLPVIPGLEKFEVKIAEHQDEYATLPALSLPDGTVITRWRLSLRERLIALINGDIYLTVNTFRQPLQPLYLEVTEPPILISADEREVQHA